MIQAIIFDFDGVLFDSVSLHYEATQAVLKEVGIDLSKEIFHEKYLGLPDLVVFEDLLPPIHSSPEHIRQLIRRKVDIYLSRTHHSPSLPAIPGAGDFLKKVSLQTQNLAVFSNGNRLEVTGALAKLDQGTLLPYFKYVTTIEDVRKGKPDPEGYLLSAKKLGVSPQDCLVIEDSFDGIRAAKAAGMKVIGLATSHPAEALKSHAHFVARDYEEASMSAKKRGFSWAL